MSKPRILFFGYSEVGYEGLSLLFERGDNVVGLITHEDNPNEKIWFKTPEEAARERMIGIPRDPDRSPVFDGDEHRTGVGTIVGTRATHHAIQGRWRLRVRADRGGHRRRECIPNLITRR